MSKIRKFHNVKLRYLPNQKKKKKKNIVKILD